MDELRPFHLAIPVDDMERNRSFYGEVLGCREGRSSDHWVDFDFFGHQLVIHLSPNAGKGSTNPVDGKEVPVPHFGVVLSMEQFDQLADSLRQRGIEFIIEPYVRFKGKPGEQATMFFYDPSGNALEFKAFKNLDQLFAQ